MLLYSHAYLISMFSLFLSDCRKLMLNTYSEDSSTDCTDRSASSGDTESQPLAVSSPPFDPVMTRASTQIPSPSRDPGYIAMTQTPLPPDHPLLRGLVVSPDERIAMDDVITHATEALCVCKFAQHRVKTKRSRKRIVKKIDIYANSTARRLMYSTHCPSFIR